MNAGRSRALVVLILAEVLLAIVFAWLSTEVAIGRTMDFDLRVRDAIHQYATPPITVVMVVVTFIGRAYVVFPVTIVVCVVFWRRGWKHQSRLFGIAMAGEVPIEYGLKWAFHRPRPQPFFGLALPGTYSFPSGHALAAMILYTTLAALLTPWLHRLWCKVVAWIAAVVMIAAIGFSRAYLGVHYPTDVLAGYLAGLVWVLGIAMTQNWSHD